MNFPTPTFGGTLIRRYKRFLADIAPDIEGRRAGLGDELTVHCANPGSMRGCSTPGNRVIISDSGNPKRKLRYTLELIQEEGSWIGVNPVRSNDVVAEALQTGVMAEEAPFDSFVREAKMGRASRVDFLLQRGEKRVFMEVKSVTMKIDDEAQFPDAVSARGLKHIHELEKARAEGHDALLFFLVNRLDSTHFAPAASIDPAYAQALKDASQRGLNIVARRACIDVRGVTVGEKMPLRL